jgi:hypothetical protein
MMMTGTSMIHMPYRGDAPALAVDHSRRTLSNSWEIVPKEKPICA